MVAKKDFAPDFGKVLDFANLDGPEFGRIILVRPADAHGAAWWIIAANRRAVFATLVPQPVLTPGALIYAEFMAGQCGASKTFRDTPLTSWGVALSLPGVETGTRGSLRLTFDDGSSVTVGADFAPTPAGQAAVALILALTNARIRGELFLSAVPEVRTSGPHLAAALAVVEAQGLHVYPSRLESGQNTSHAGLFLARPAAGRFAVVLGHQLASETAPESSAEPAPESSAPTAPPDSDAPPFVD